MHYQRWKKHGNPAVVKSVPSPAWDWIQGHKNHSGPDCLKWPFHISPDGYGRAHDKNDGHKLKTASRVMLIQAKGQPPSSKHECAHTCGKGNEGCVNPDHLYWATPAQNQADRVRHGTSNRGEQQWKSKLTASDVLKIRSLYPRMKQDEIAKSYNVDQSTISNIVTGKKWAWLYS